jgi:glycolate oxidase FAD binding subunit
MANNDISKQLQTQVQTAIADKTRLYIHGGNSKHFYGNTTQTDQDLDVSPHSGIIDYQPSELVVTVRAGTKLVDLEKILAAEGQILPFEPPIHHANSTIGGVVAAGLSGPRRPFSGAVRDHVLGIQMINGHGQIVNFGGQVMKNVAGYDVSRLMVGSLGSLGVLLNISIKLIPTPVHNITLAIDASTEKAITLFNQWRPTPLPISASCFYEDCLYIRLSGGIKTTTTFSQKIEGDILPRADGFWQAVRNQQHEFFNTLDKPLWRLSFPPATLALRRLESETLIEWNGAQYWLYSNAPPNIIRDIATKHQGHATLFKGDKPEVNCFQPLPRALITLQKRLKKRLDPHGIFSSGRLYKDF